MTDQTSNVSPTWHLTDYNDFDYLDSNFSGLRFSQGIVWNPDAGEWISSWQFGLARLTSDFKFLQTTGSVDLSTGEPISAIPKALADMGLDHIGDFDYANGKLYVALDNSELDYTTGYVAVFNASDLSYTGQLYELTGAQSNPHNDVASWVAVDTDVGLGYGKEYKSGNTINVYNLADWSFKQTLTMDMNLDHVQGAKVLDGMMYMASDNDSQSIYCLDLSTGHVEELFRLPKPGSVETEVEGIEAKKNADGNVELTVELIIDPHGDSYGDEYTRVFTYTLDGSSTDVPLHHTWTVNAGGDDTNADDMALTLREAISKAEAGDTITFAGALSGQTITLSDAELALSKDITIEGDLDGDGKADITIDGSAAANTLHVAGAHVTLDGVVVLHDEDSDGSSIVVDDGASVTVTHGATTNLATDGDDVLAGTNGVDVIDAGAGADVVQGGRGDDVLSGGTGSDMLVGGAGADTMAGGKGNDTYFVAESGDAVTELGKGGTDLVKASLNYTLAANVENLSLLGTADLDGTGNRSANAITGNSGANTLLGLDGDDVLSGGTGQDVLTGGAGADHFVFATGDTGAIRALADTITDMLGAKGDRIDLHLIDADEAKSGNQKLHFIGNDAFSGHAGELRFARSDGDTYVYGDTDGDAKADFTLHLDGAAALKADYFVL
jgi:Ca2+-binding RTX toxin-like protein